MTISASWSLQGLTWIAGGVAVALWVAFVFRTRWPAWLVATVLGVAGAAITWGVLLLQPEPSPVETTVALAVMAVMVPVHVRAVLGRFGPR